MSASVRTRAARRGLRIACGLLLAIAGTALDSALPGAVAAQELADSVATRQIVYQRELSAWRAAVQARRAAEDELGDAINLIERARFSGDAAALASAQRQAQARAGDVEFFDARVEEVEVRLDRARSRLLEALDARLLRLQEELLDATTRAERDRIGAFVDDLENQYRELEAEAEAGLQAPPEFYPALRSSPLDGRDEWETKAGLLERKAATADTLIAEARETVGRLEDRLRLERTRQDTRANRDRFGDALPPVGTTGTRVREGAGIVSDTTDIPTEDLPLAVQISRWQAYIESLEDFRQILREQAAEFRRRLNRAEPVRLPRFGGPGAGR